MELNGFSPQQKKILALLNDEPQSPRMLRTGLGDEFMEDATIYVNISNLRKKLHIYGQDIMCRGGFYTLVRFTKCASKE